MSTRYPGGLITKTPIVPAGPYQTGAAPGVWTLDQQMYWQKLNLWPIAGNVLVYSWIAQITGTYKSYQFYDMNTNGNIMYIRTGDSTSKYLVQMNTNGVIQSQVQISGGTSSYEEFEQNGALYNKTADYAVFPTVDGSSSNMGAGYIQGPFTTSSTCVKYRCSGGGSGSIQYPNSGAYYIGTIGGADENIITTAFGGSDYAYFGMWNKSSATYYTYRLTPSSSTRTYSYTMQSSVYSTKIAINTIDNNPAQYTKTFCMITTNGANAASSIIAKSLSLNDGVYLINSLSTKILTRWLVYAYNTTGTSVSSLFSMDYNLYVKDQLVLRDTSSSSIVYILNYWQPTTANGAADDNDVYVWIQDPAQAYTYYLVIWRKSDNNNATDGGSGNTGGTWNVGSGAKKFVFDSTYSNGGASWGGTIGAAYYTADGAYYMQFASPISASGNDIIFRLPVDISQIDDATYSGVVTISSGSTVNTRVNAFKQQSLGLSWYSRSVTMSEVSMGATSITNTLSTPSLTFSYENKQNIP